jgi:ATP-dependent protease ClpP protease subunit
MDETEMNLSANVQLASFICKTHNDANKMTTRTKRSTRKDVEFSVEQTSLPLFVHSPFRNVEYFGVVNYATTERVIEEVSSLMAEDPREEIHLSVTCAGGPTGTAMSFYDHMRYVLKPRLVTIGSGDVDSSGIIIFLAGERRFLTKNTTLLLHRAGRIFEGGKRLTASELEAMVREDNLKDFQYASVLSERSHGRLTTEKALQLMENNTILTPIEMISFGLADSILE